jgi:hypothetical protein
MGGLEELLNQGGWDSVDVFVRDMAFEPAQQGLKSQSMTELELCMVFKAQSGLERVHCEFLDYISPSRRLGYPRQGIQRQDLSYSLASLSKEKDIFLERGYELFLLNKTMKLLAKLDPRIAGNGTSPRIRIGRIGNSGYDLGTENGLGIMMDFYTTVTDEYRSERRLMKQLGNFNHPFVQSL